MSRPNKCIKDENGKDIWVSRSVVVIPIVFKLDQNTGDIYTLVEKRGPDVSHCGEWCCPCGYLDWDESLEEACQREVKEETGLLLDTHNIIFFQAESNKNSANQTVDLWYMCWTNNETEINKSNIETIGEILDVKWLKVGHVVARPRIFRLFNKHINLNIYKKTIENGYGIWAFKKHPEKIIDMLIMIKNGKLYMLDE